MHKFITYRDTKTFNADLFLHDLENQPWSVIDIFEDAIDALDFLTEAFNNVLSNHAPKKKRRVKRQKQPNGSIITYAMKTRDEYHASKNMNK